MLLKKVFTDQELKNRLSINPVVVKFAIAYLVASILDILLTQWALNIGLTEFNPLLSMLGSDGFYLFKLAVATYMTGLMIWKNKVGLSIFAATIMVVVCGWNLSQILA